MKHILVTNDFLAFPIKQFKRKKTESTYIYV